MSGGTEQKTVIQKKTVVFKRLFIYNDVHLNEIV